MSWDETRKMMPDREEGGFWKPEEGDNKIRIVSEPFSRILHFPEGGGKPTPCSQDESCQFCAQKPPTVRSLFHIIDRKSKKFRLVDFGPMITDQILELQGDEKWGFSGEVMPYDINIKRKGTGLETEYTVLPDPDRTDLTDKEKEGVMKLEPLKDLLEKINKSKEGEMPPF